MALSQSSTAIGVVSDLLISRLQLAIGDSVVVGRPQDAISSNPSGDKLNLFLYQISFDESLKNYPLDTGQSPPLWIVLHYLLTAFNDTDSDTPAAHRLLGKGLTALQGLNFINSSDPFLKDNPEPLKVSFDTAGVELLSKLMQGSDEKYRLSAAFQVRPVMLMVDEEPAYAPVIKTVGPPKQGVIPAEGEGIIVLPSLGPIISAVEPQIFETGDSITIKGPDLNGVDKVRIGAADLTAVFSEEGHITVIVPTTLSAGDQPVTVSRLLPTGRRICSSALLGKLLPTLSAVAIGAIQGMSGSQMRKIDLTGSRLGGPDDDILVALYKDDGERVHLFGSTGTAAQTSLTSNIPEDDFPDAGNYLVILRVNGVQATNSPDLVWA